MSLAERIRSPKFGDSYGYGRYAEGILQFGRLNAIDGTPILKHVPGIPLLLALTFEALGSVRPFLVLQVLFLFLSLFFFLAKIRDGFPAAAVMATPIVIALHPSIIKHAAGVMADLLFGSMLLWVAFFLWRREPNSKAFLRVGIVFALAAYLRETAVALLLMTGLAYLVRDGKRHLRSVVQMFGVFLLLLSPWAIRNQQLTGTFTPLTTKTADLFYYYSIPLTREIYNPLGPGFQETEYNYTGLYETYDREMVRWMSPGVPEGASRRIETLKERFDPWANRPLPPNPLEEGLRNYVSRPSEQIGSLLLKTLAFINKPAILAHLAPTSFGPLLIIGNVAFYAFHVGIILWGVVLSFIPRNNPFPFLGYWIFAQYVQALFFWSEERYLMPLYPFLILLALSWYWRRWVRGDQRRGGTSSGGVMESGAG